MRPLPLLDPQQHALGVDVADLERDDFGDAQPGAVGGGERRLVLRPRRRLQQQRDLLDAQHRRQPARLAHRRELLIARQIELLVGEQRFILRLLRHRLIVLRLVDRRIDFGEHVALLDVLALDEIDRHQLAVDLRAHGDRVQCADGADAIEIDRHVLYPWRRRQHRHGKIARQAAATRAAAWLGLIGQPADIAEAAEDQQRDRQRHHSPQHAATTLLPCGLCGFVQFRLKEHRPAFPS